MKESGVWNLGLSGRMFYLETMVGFVMSDVKMRSAFHYSLNFDEIRKRSNVEMVVGNACCRIPQSSINSTASGMVLMENLPSTVITSRWLMTVYENLVRRVRLHLISSNFKNF